MHKDKFLELVNSSGIGHWMLAEACNSVFEWDKWIKEIPYIKFPAHWEVQIIPPFAAAMIRFRVKHPSGGSISIYLDCHNHLGCGGTDSRGNARPYWEIYPGKDGDTDRYNMNDIQGLLDGIEGALKANV